MLGALPATTLLVDFALEVPAARVINEVRGETQLCELKSHGIKLRPRAARGPDSVDLSCTDSCFVGSAGLWITSAGIPAIPLDMSHG